jgi:hypothetical protein
VSDHAQRIYGLSVKDTAIRARTLVRHLAQGDVPPEFTARDLYAHHWSGLDTEAAVAEPLDLLEHLGWLRSRRRQTGGRPSVVYTLNPRFVEVPV